MPIKSILKAIIVFAFIKTFEGIIKRELERERTLEAQKL